METKSDLIVIEEFQTSYLGKFQSLLKECFPEHKKKEDSVGARMRYLYNFKFGWIKDRIRNFIFKRSVTTLFSDECDRKAFVAILEPQFGIEKVIGFVLVTYDGRGSWFISELMVHPNFRRRKIGSRLLNTALSYIKRKKGREVFLMVEVSNVAALNLYKKYGFDLTPRTLMSLKLNS